MADTRRGLRADGDPPTADIIRAEWRAGRSWGVTIVARGDGPDQDGDGRRDGDALLGVVFDPEVAQHIVAVHNRTRCVFCGAAVDSDGDCTEECDHTFDAQARHRGAVG
jgi:hypothetical protein